MFFARLCVQNVCINKTNEKTNKRRRTILCINLSACVIFAGSSSPLSLIRRPNRPRRAVKIFCNVFVEQFVSHCICRSSSKTLSALVKSDPFFFARTRFFFRGARNIHKHMNDARPRQPIASSPCTPTHHHHRCLFKLIGPAWHPGVIFLKQSPQHPG